VRTHAAFNYSLAAK
jgi:hypothetical protein